MVLSTALTYVGCLWIREGEWIGATIQMDEAVPPIPALAGLLFLLAVNPVLRRLGRRLGMSRGEILATYVVLSLSISVVSVGVGQMLNGWQLVAVTSEGARFVLAGRSALIPFGASAPRSKTTSQDQPEEEQQ